jgi:hypothetical protein
MLSNYQSAINARVKYSDTAAMLDPYLTAAVTSVGLSMPVAFNVSNSPITSTGTIAVTGAGTAAQYIRGDGQLATLPSGASGGSSVDYYLNGGTSQGTIGGSTYYEMSKIPVIGTGADFDRTNAQGNGLIAQFITDSLDPNRTEIPAGAWNFEMFFSASSNGGTPSYYIELLKYDGTNFTSIASGSANPEGITSGTIIDLYLSSLAVPFTALSITDRLVVRVYVTTSGKTITLHTQDGHLCLITTSFAGGVTSLNGLAANTQYLAVDTVGSDFNINSLVDTHTFNLPTASATKRGALSSTDWSTFNGKMNYADTVSLSNRINTKLNSADTASLSNRINTKADALSGTTNTVAKFISGTTIGNSNIKDNGNAVSINATAGSNGALQVGSYGGNILMNTDNSTGGLIFKNTSSSNKLWDFSSYNNDINFNESGVATPVITLQAGGNVGIKTNAPAYQLEVNGTFKAVGVATFGSTLSNGTYTYTLPSATGTLALTSSFDTSSLSNRINLKLNISDTASMLSGYQSAINSKQLQLNGTGFVKASGTTISYDNNTYATTSALSGYLPLTGGTLTGALTVGVASGLNLILEKSTGAYLSFNNGSTVRGSINGNNGTDGINLNYGASQTTALAIASTGAATFSNSVTATLSLYLKEASTNAFRIYTDGANGSLFFRDEYNSATRMTIAQSGNVGIGTSTDAGYKLDVNGTIRVTGTLTGTNALFSNSVGVGGATIASWAGGTENVLQVKNSSIYEYGGYETALSVNTYYNAGWKYIATNTASQIQLSSGALNFKLAVSGSAGTAITWTTPLTIASTGTSTFTTTENQGGVYVTSATDNTTLRVASTATGGQEWRLQSTGGASGLGQGKLIFKVGGTETASYIPLTLTTDNSTNGGRVGIGTTSPSYTLHVNGSVAGTSAYNNLSDKRFKKDIEPIKNALDKVLLLEGVTYNWNLDTTVIGDKNLDSLNHIGFVAQDIEKILPQVVTTANDKDKTKSVAYSDIVPVLTEAIKELSAQIEILKSKIQTLENK